mmetsp:Transcript_26439/g.46621  ORF Transcript_26439/g.46621 Transcript_26439/m.46621 type:complete len:104 (+) Transcript_26439:119-430(+)
MLLCYENVTTTIESFTQTVQQVGRFFWPADANYTSKPWNKVHKFKVEGGGGHSTSHDTALRTHWARVIQLYDQKYLQGEIARGNAEFGCLSELPAFTNSAIEA